MIVFFVHGIATPQGNYKPVRAGRFAKLREATKGLKEWREDVANAAQHYAYMHTGPVTLQLIFHMPRTKSLPKKHYRPKTTQPDVDKLQRAIFDALQGVMYTDDAQVDTVLAHKRYAEPGARVGVEVRIAEVVWEQPPPHLIGGEPIVSQEPSIVMGH